MSQNCSHEEVVEEKVAELYKLVFHYVFPVLIGTGFFTNLLNLIVLTRPLMLGKTYRWLRALACVDLILCVLTVPVCVATGGIKPLTSSALAFYYSLFGWSLSIGAQILSFYLMGMFAFERFLAVCRHDLYPRSQTDAVFQRGVATATLAVLLLYVPTIVVGTVDCCDGKCRPKDGYSKQLDTYPWYPAYAWLREICSRLVPAVAITYCNVRITLRLRHLRGIREGFSRGVPAARRDRERRLVLVLFWFTALFYVFNTPVTVYYLGFLHTKSKTLRSNPLIFAAISNLLQMMGNVSNFVLYFLISPEFHNTLCSLLKSTLFLPSCIKADSRRTFKIAPLANANTTTVSDGNVIVAAAAGVAEESPTQSDSGYQHDVTDSVTHSRGSRCSWGDESPETPSSDNP